MKDFEFLNYFEIKTNKTNKLPHLPMHLQMIQFASALRNLCLSSCWLPVLELIPSNYATHRYQSKTGSTNQSRLLLTNSSSYSRRRRPSRVLYSRNSICPQTLNRLIYLGTWHFSSRAFRPVPMEVFGAAPLEIKTLPPCFSN